MPDPKLVAAMEDIKAVLKKHDIAAFVILGSPTHSEFLFQLEASWTCCKQDGDDEIRLRSKLEDYGGDQAEQVKVLAATVGTVAGFRDISAVAVENLENLLLQIGKTVTVEHFSKPG